jgi:hypothetical protein
MGVSIPVQARDEEASLFNPLPQARALFHPPVEPQGGFNRCVDTNGLGGRSPATPKKCASELSIP